MPGSRATLTWISTSRPGRARVAVALERLQGGLAGERVDQAHVGHDQRHTAALELADEVPGEELAVGGHLGLEILGAVLPHEPTPARASVGRSSRATYLVAASTCTLVGLPSGAGGGEGDLLARTGEVLAGTRSSADVGDQLSHATPAWRPAPTPSRRWEK